MFLISSMLSTWVKQDNGSKAAQLYFIHLHISHLIDELSENSEKKMQGFKALNKNTEPTLCKTLGTLNTRNFTYQIWRRPLHSAHFLCIKNKSQIRQYIFITQIIAVKCSLCLYPGNSLLPSMYLSKMAPTPTLCALSRCSSEARRTPSFKGMERWENEAIRSSFHPEKLSPFTHRYVKSNKILINHDI